MPTRSVPPLCFVILKKASFPKEAALIDALKAFPELGKTKVSIDAAAKTIVLSAGKISATAELINAPLADKEAETATEFSLSGFGGEWKLKGQRAHFVVTAKGVTTRKLEALIIFTRLAAALASAVDAIGVLWGDSGTTHHPAFMHDIASSELPVPVWVGFSMHSDEEDGDALLSQGMDALGLPELLLSSPKLQPAELEFFYDLLGYVVRRGKKLPEGDSVGRTAKEKLKVQYVPSPTVEKTKVAWIALTSRR